ncbi:MAG: HRDC domain-containing protein [Candidatus Saccharimonadales bacterium]
MKQAQALQIMKLGHNVFLTGEPGAGKTHVINRFIKHCKKHNIGVGITASTGIAATHINGMTIHSWSGIGINSELDSKQLANLAGKSQLKARFRKSRVLIIDEISMLDGARLELINQICKMLKDEDKPFGGLQVILCGDLFQLPPINRGGGDIDFAHFAKAWDELNLKVCYLKEQHRQEEDPRLLRLLREIRSNELSEESMQILEVRLEEETPDEDITRLYTHNSNVDNLNAQKLAQIDAESQIFAAHSHGPEQLVEQLKKSCLAPENLELKVGAQVLCVANNPAAGYINGTRAEVIDFSKDNNAPIIQLSSGRKITMELNSWRIEDGEKTLAEINQYPLRLAWAITVHKSQGMSLDSAEIDLSRAFTPGMGYVALSRLRSIEGLYLRGINQTALRVHEEISNLDTQLQQLSKLAIKSLDGISKSKLKDMHSHIQQNLAGEYADYDKELFELLREWRSQTASEHQLPAYMVFDDKTLVALSAEQPKNNQELLAVPGVGEKKLEQYGQDIITIIKDHLAQQKKLI